MTILEFFNQNPALKKAYERTKGRKFEEIYPMLALQERMKQEKRKEEEEESTNKENKGTK